MKSPKPNQNKPTNTHKTKARKHWTGISKNYSTNHKVHHVAAPFDEEKRQQQKNLISHATNQTTPFHQWFKQHRPAHTPKRSKQSQTNQTKNHWHTIEFSHNTRTLSAKPYRLRLKRLARHYFEATLCVNSLAISFYCRPYVAFTFR